MDDFATRLLAWYDTHGRHDLPWQRDATPYHVWLSEIMLQQTQVATVIPYYERFTAAFPSLEALAAADIDAVLHHWSGLGYYARARNLHAAARVIIAEYEGVFPADLDALQALPGIGRSTAGAILSSALGGRAPILDGNVKRVLARYHGVEGWPGSAATAAQLWRLAEEHTPHSRVADYTQAIMDLGATLCRRNTPDCPRCPVGDCCAARAAGRTADFPGRRAKRALPTRRTLFMVACTPSRHVLLERRPSPGIWGGLWCFPEIIDVAADVDYAAAARRLCRDRLAVEAVTSRDLPALRHSFSHYHLDIRPVLLILAREPGSVAEGDTLRAWPVGEPPSVGLAAPVRRLWDHAAVIVTGGAGADIHQQGEFAL